jgi:hypothetical protein
VAGNNAGVLLNGVIYSLAGEPPISKKHAGATVPYVQAERMNLRPHAEATLNATTGPDQEHVAGCGGLLLSKEMHIEIDAEAVPPANCTASLTAGHRTADSA